MVGRDNIYLIMFTAFDSCFDYATDPKLSSLLKMLIWVQDQLDEKVYYPRITNLSTASLENPAV